MADFPWKDTFKYYALEKTWIIAYILIGILIFSIILPTYNGPEIGLMGVMAAALLIGCFEGFIFITLPISIICTLIRRILNKPIKEEEKN